MEQREIIAVRYGTLLSRRSAMFHQYETYGEPDGDQRLDYFFWVVRDGERTLMIDTGFDPEVAERRGRTCLCPPRAALARLGIDPMSVSQVLVTHFHYDHVGNLDAFPEAELVVPARELEFWSGPSARREQFAHHVEREEIARIETAHRQGRVRTFAGRATVAPGVTAITVGGHSPGQAVVVVEAARGPVVLASDAVHFYEELEHDRPFAVVVDLEEMYMAYDLLRELARETGGPVVPGHDADVMARFPSAGGEARDLAVRLG